MIQKKNCGEKATELSLEGDRNKSSTLIYQPVWDYNLSNQKTLRSIYEVQEKEKEKETSQKF